ncbi:hypothetical protein SAMN05421640_2245 [Ekhidna lutea]|uniref:DUF4382 domain-containing protein n=1 Tax=Ekhidna lutea TaxID=447679 RepID=A0A239JN10_EKHLU|nr:hypothetical protein [Ekhidna lutea]SNT06838.1 hypothetical protein SAMN05421640_2245 [Ekhidna lutea]
MKHLRKLLSASLLSLIIFSCGEAGFGFNVSADSPVTAPISITIPATVISVDPDATSINYSLGDVSAFNDALRDLGSAGGGIDRNSIELIGMSYEIEGIDSEENLPLDELTIHILSSTGIIATIPIETTGGMLTNVAKTEINLTSTAGNSIISELSNSSDVNSEVIFDLGTVPADPNSREIDFDFKLYFNVLLKVRNL